MSTERTAVVGLLGRTAQALMTPHPVEGYARLVDPTWSRNAVMARVTHVHRDAVGSVTLSLRPNRLWTGFRAGQHVLLTVEVDGVRHTRCYSPANAEQDRRVVELTVKAHPDGVVSNHLHRHAAPGMVVELSPAQGEFTLPDARPDHLLLVSGGSGITPVMSMLRTLCAEGHTGRVTFLHYSLTADAMAYREEVATLAAAHGNVEVVRVFTDQPGHGDLDGFFDAGQLAAADADWAGAEAYVCGPPPLMAAVEAHYRAADLGDQVHTEAFTLAEFAAEAGGSIGGTVRFTASGTEVASDGRTILAQAEAAGLRPTSGCRMGICHTCPRQLERGVVRNVTTGATTPAGRPVRICVSTPDGDVDIDL